MSTDSVQVGSGKTHRPPGIPPSLLPQLHLSVSVLFLISVELENTETWHSLIQQCLLSTHYVAETALEVAEIGEGLKGRSLTTSAMYSSWEE